MRSSTRSRARPAHSLLGARATRRSSAPSRCCPRYFAECSAEAAAALLAALRILVPAALHLVGPALVIGPGVQRARDRRMTRVACGRLRTIEPVGSLRLARRSARARAGANDRTRVLARPGAMPASGGHLIDL